MSRALTLLFAIVCYAIFFATFLYLIVFVGDLPVRQDARSTSDLDAARRVAVDHRHRADRLFGLQHSVMARPGFKRSWTRVVPPAAERSVYVLAASIALMILFLCWQPLGRIVWKVEPTSPGSATSCGRCSGSASASF